MSPPALRQLWWATVGSLGSAKVGIPCWNRTSLCGFANRRLSCSANGIETKLQAEVRPPPACDYSFSSDSRGHRCCFAFRKSGGQEVVNVLVFHKAEVAQDANIDDAACKFLHRQEFVDHLKHA